MSTVEAPAHGSYSQPAPPPALAELLTPQPFSMTTFANEHGYDDMVIVRDIAFHSLCAHHLLPLTGVAHVAYIPDERIVGLSKVARLVEHIARQPQTQERLTSEVADAMESAVLPRGVGVAVAAASLCMSLRGVPSAEGTTITTAVRGCLRDDRAARSEFLALTAAPRR
jgi:GTP cyclohydrolase I